MLRLPRRRVVILVAEPSTVEADYTPIVAFVRVLVFTGSFSLSMGGIAWVIMSDIFLMNMKWSAGSLITFVSWLGSWIFSYAFSFLMDCNHSVCCKVELSEKRTIRPTSNNTDIVPNLVITICTIRQNRNGNHFCYLKLDINDL
ncbi:unnamed protein product [Malus baccata var. baccata]